MAEQQLYLYHCDRCGDLFKSKLRAKEDIRCGTCGEHPIKPKFTAVNEMPISIRHSENSTHGVPGKDLADNFSIQKKKQHKQWLVLGIMWVTCLAVITLMVHRVNKKAQAAKLTDVVLGAEDSAYLARKNEAIEKCARRFIQFVGETITPAKSSHILNGSDLVLDINRYYATNLMKQDLAKSRIIKYQFDETGEHAKLLALYRYQPEAGLSTNTYEFEVLFWKKDEEWFVDWPHFVRLGESNWFRFSEDKKIGSPKRFKLYARELNTESIILSGYQEYKFSEAQNNSTTPNQLSSSVYVEHQTDLRSTLTKNFNRQEQLRKDKVESENIIGSFDPPRSIRLDVTLDFEEIEGEIVMVLKKIHKLDWETPPTEED